jgi:hypothetical protein
VNVEAKFHKHGELQNHLVQIFKLTPFDNVKTNVDIKVLSTIVNG